MNVQRALVRNTAWYGVVTAVGLLSGLVLMGDLSYVLWAERTLIAAAALGFPLAAVRYTAESFARADVARAWGFVRLFLRRQLVAGVVVSLGAGLPALLGGMGLTLAVSCWLQRQRVHDVYGAGVHAQPAPMTADVRAYLLPLSMVAVLDAVVWDRSPVFFLGIYAPSAVILWLYGAAYLPAAPLGDLARTTGAGVLTLVVAWTVAGDSHQPLRLVAAATAGILVFLLACVAARLVGPREWGPIATSTRRLLAMRPSGVTP